MRSRGEPLATTCKVVTAQCYKTLKRIQKNPQLDHVELDFHANFIGKYCFYRIFLYILKSYCISLVLSFALSQ